MDAVVVSWARRHFGRQQWTHQQDSAQAHRAKATQKWYKAHFSADFITSAEWRPTRLISTQSYMVNFEARACAKPYKNLEALEQSLQRGGGDCRGKSCGARPRIFGSVLHCVLKQNTSV